MTIYTHKQIKLTQNSDYNIYNGVGKWYPISFIPNKLQIDHFNRKKIKLTQYSVYNISISNGVGRLYLILSIQQELQIHHFNPKIDKNRKK